LQPVGLDPETCYKWKLANMTDESDGLASRNVSWQLNVPQSVLHLYFDYIRVLPSWKRSFPRYIPAMIRDVVELEPNKTKIVTETGEYVFMFEERNTLVSAAAEVVKTGVLIVLHNEVAVLHLNVSPPDRGDVGDSWVTRGIEEFKDGEWIGELGQLHSRLAEWETEQKKKDELSQKDQLETINELKEKLSKLPRVGSKTKSWFRQLFRRSGT
jgi:hypothetical protein